jgi:hypothetical protein
MTYLLGADFKISLIRKGTKFETDKRVDEGKGCEIVDLSDLITFQRVVKSLISIFNSSKNLLICINKPQISKR